ncbi:hypothetical protein Nepgr_028920 [Nepenthes gracilis]|uniref:Uncharacterized protein n=1 Tax=Nepenthes gracilis TaxID=150966 RepID=A0AAD3TEF0_NEPGR|nr:hypothetical protein Nepgr_028920 [Nepenthes gracilis]
MNSQRLLFTAEEQQGPVDRDRLSLSTQAAERGQHPADSASREQPQNPQSICRQGPQSSQSDKLAVSKPHEKEWKNVATLESQLPDLGIAIQPESESALDSPR